jgi:hypothetical protein
MISEIAHSCEKDISEGFAVEDDFVCSDNVIEFHNESPLVSDGYSRAAVPPWIRQSTTVTNVKKI